MSQKILTMTVVLVFLFSTLTVSVFGRAKLDDGSKGFVGSLSAAAPCHAAAGHRVGKIVLQVNNNGTFGDGFAVKGIDYFTGLPIPSCEYPKRSNTTYLFAASFWIGAVVGRDTLVSVGADGWQQTREMFPDDEVFAVIRKRSIIDPSKPDLYENAISEEDYIFEYTDTLTEGVDPDYFYSRPHQPLYIKVTERSFAWSYAYAEDFVLFDYRIKNIGSQPLKGVYMGIYVDADVCAPCDQSGFDDDICGFLPTITTHYRGSTHEDEANIAWIADNDGDLDKAGPGQGEPVPHVTATRIVRTPAKELDVSFNWWVSQGSSALDFGPREKPFKGRWKEPYRDLTHGGLGTPEGDVNKYYFLRNREFDYDQVRTYSIGQQDTLWLYPPNRTLARTVADGYDTRYLLSFGPFDIDEGQTLPISLAYLAGEDFHTDKDNIDNLPGDWEAFYRGLNFDDLGKNAVWAEWIYDNPGVDTDGDGDSGAYWICPLETVILDSICDTVIENDDTVITCVDIVDTTIADTIWYKGDGVPDFRGASPPPAPDLWVHPSVGSLRIRFNGLRSETTRDVFSRALDFEGYRVYLARDARSASYSVATSYDIEDYNKFVSVYDPIEGEHWELLDMPFTLEELRCLYGDSCNDPFFDPEAYTPSSTYIHPLFPDSQFYFAAQDFNQSELGLPGGIRKLYPDQPFPSHLNPDSARPEELTEDSCFKYFEYEYVIDRLLPTVPYWVNVTAFDFGSPSSGLPSLESSVTVGAKHAYPLSSAAEVAEKDLKVFVYPNPYRIDAEYRALGFEGRATEFGVRPDDRVRAIHFANLPPKCTIRIHTLDGDLVREIVHQMDPSDPNASQDEWDLITRNTQLAVSGIYYWTVEADDGEVQIGKLVIIM